MADILERGARFLDDQRHKHMTRPVVYQRTEGVEAQATVGRTVFEQADGLGGLHRVESRDYLLRARDLVIGGVRATPAQGDRVVDGGLVYEVAPFGGEPAFRFSDPLRETLRVHTKFIGEEATP